MAINYSAPEVMEMAVQTEKGGKLYYEAVAAQQTDPKLKSLFQFLAGEEAGHIRTFEEIARQVKVAPTDVPYNWEEVIPYLRAVTESRYFLASGSALVLAKDAKTPIEALHHAMRFEKETLVFYTQVRDMVGGSNRAAVDKLINEEKVHILRLAGVIEALGDR